MKQRYFSIITLLFCSFLLQAQTVVDFNTATDLTDNFNPSPGAIFTNGTIGGISDTGAVEISPSTENWTSITGIPVVALETYTISAFVRIDGKTGRGGIGFTTSNSNNTNKFGHPPTALGYSYYGGGGELINNSSTTAVSSPNYVQLNWYFIELTLTNTATNTFDIYFSIYNSNSNGAVGSLLSSESFIGITNTDLGSVNLANLYPYFCHENARLSKLDNFTFSSASTLSIDGASLTDLIAIYPNPTQDFVNIAGLEGEESYKIYNTVGAQVAKGMVSNGKQIEIQNLTNGMYFLKLESGRTFKFLKE